MFSEVWVGGLIQVWLDFVSALWFGFALFMMLLMELFWFEFGDLVVHVL